MHQQLRGGRSHQKTPDYRHREGGKRLLMSLVWLMRGERDTVCHSVPLSLFNLVIGWTQTAAQMKRDKDQRVRKTCFHVVQTHSKEIKEENEQRKKKKR